MTDCTSPLFAHVTLIGCGLIGSSVALGLREKGIAEKITGFDLDPHVAAKACALGVIDDAASGMDTAVREADLVILATPAGATGPLCKALDSRVRPGTTVMDTGSVKGDVVRTASALRDDILFVPCHPVSGTEQSGPGAGFAALFHDRWCIITPLERKDAAYIQAVEKIKTLWELLGADVEIMDAAHHDIALAVTSHLPHLIAFTLVGAAADIETVAENEIIKYSAGGFRDFTRIAASDPVMWRDVFLGNRDAVLEVLGRFSEELALLQRAIRWGDGETLYRAFVRGRKLRRAIVAAGQETAAPDFGRKRPDRSGG